MVVNLLDLKKQLQTQVDLTDIQLKQLQQYAELLQEYNQKMNLTSIDQLEEIYSKHFYDSLLPFSLVEFQAGDCLADVGTGAGFPGLVLKIAYPNLSVTLIEPTAKRCHFLQVVIDALKLENVQVINKRAEDLSNLRACFDYVTARAVSNLNILSELCAPLLKVGGRFVILRGKDGYQEIKQAQSAFETLHLTQEKLVEMNYLDNTRINAVYRLTKTIASKYPRHYGVIKKKPL